MKLMTRRTFVADVTKGMVIASVGAGVAADLLPGPVYADGPDELTFGPLEPLVDLMQETPADRLMPVLVNRLQQGTELQQVLAAGALANARAFGGEDYVGFHTMMAMAPAWYMARELPAALQPLAVLKVLHRNARRLQEVGGQQAQVLRIVAPAEVLQDRSRGEALRTHVRRENMNEAERAFAASCQRNAEDAFNDLLLEVQDATEVHRVVLPYRAWDLMSIIGREQAHTLLRQSVRFCVRAESPRYVQNLGAVRTLVPQLLERYRLPERATGRRTADDAWVEQMSQTIFRSSAADAADAAAAALAEGFPPDAIGEAISLAANQLVLRDRGRPPEQAAPNRAAGSVHGDSIGVHACDSANAWRNIARISNPRNKVVCTILGAYHAAWDRVSRGGDFLNWSPYPTEEARQAVRQNGRDALLGALDEAIEGQEQMRAAAIAQVYGDAGHDARPIFDLLLRHALKTDGALHAEKYYRTCTEEYNSTRPAFRWRQVVALARVSASAAGQPAPGLEETCRLLNVRI